MAWGSHASSAKHVSQGKATVKQSIDFSVMTHSSPRHRELPDNTQILAATSLLHYNLQYTFSRKRAQKLFH